MQRNMLDSKMFRKQVPDYENPVWEYLRSKERVGPGTWSAKGERAAWLHAYALTHALKENLLWVPPVFYTKEEQEGTLALTWTHGKYETIRELEVIITSILFCVSTTEYCTKEYYSSSLKEQKYINDSDWHEWWGWLVFLKGYDIF